MYDEYTSGNTIFSLALADHLGDNAAPCFWDGRTAFSRVEMLKNIRKNDGIDDADEVRVDYFVHKDGLTFAGTHLIVDLWQGEGFNDPDLIESTLRRSIDAAGATLLHFHIHAFEPDGLSGVAVLAESHISFHSWPERDFMALDIFMCGKADPYRAIPVLKEAFKPGTVQVNEIKRGIVS